VGQLGESGEYWMGRSGRGLLSIQSSEGGSPRLCRLRPCRLGLNEQALIMYWRIQDLWGPINLVASTVAELDDTPPYFIDVQWDSVRATHSVSIEAYAWKTALG
jgi:hypothetical protein